MQNPTIGPDGLRIPTQLILSDLAAEDIIAKFAGGLIPAALNHTQLDQTLAEALHQPAPESNPLRTALLALDAEIDSLVGPTRRVFPLPGFLTYQAQLPPDKFPLHSLRLPPLNPDGHFIFIAATEQHYFALRLDLHPEQKVLGHVRIALSSTTRPPIRLEGAEHRLNRQILSPEIVGAALVDGDEILDTPLTQIERDQIRTALINLA